MGETTESRFDKVLDALSQWPTHDRLRLAHRLLEGISLESSGGQDQSGRGLHALLGVIESIGQPSDDQCDQALADERLRKCRALDVAILNGELSGDPVRVDGDEIARRARQAAARAAESKSS